MKPTIFHLRQAAGVAWLCVVPAVFGQATNQAGTNNVYPIDLPMALRLANAQNLDVQIASERLNEAKAEHASAVERFFPWLSPGAAFARHEGNIQAVNGPILDIDKQSYTAGGVLKAEINFGDAIYRSLASRQLVNAAGNTVESQRADSTLAAAQGFFDLAKAKANAGVFEEAVRVSEDYQRQLHDAVAAGLAFKGDELRAQVQTERDQISLRQAVEAQRVAAARLAQVLHLDPSVELVPQDAGLAPLTLVETNAALDSLVQRALKSRPEMREARSVENAAADTKNGAVYGPLIPSVTAQAFFGGLGGGPNEDTGSFGQSEDYFVGLGWRVGPGGLFDVGNIRASRARLATAKLGDAKLRDEIIREVVENQARADSQRDQLEMTRRNLDTASETLRLTRERKEFGVGAVLEDIQSQQDLTRAQADYLDAVADYNKAEFGLNRAIGGAAPRDK